MQVTMELTAYTATESSQPSHKNLEKVTRNLTYWSIVKCHKISIIFKADCQSVLRRKGNRMSRIPHFLDNWLTDAAEVSLTCQSPFTPRQIPGTHFC
jgi:hypothetical protein